jgi:hypothetical protein
MAHKIPFTLALIWTIGFVGISFAADVNLIRGANGEEDTITLKGPR